MQSEELSLFVILKYVCAASGSVSGKGVRSQNLLWTEHDRSLILQAERFGISIWVIGMFRVMMDRIHGKHR